MFRFSRFFPPFPLEGLCINMFFFICSAIEYNWQLNVSIWLSSDRYIVRVLSFDAISVNNSFRQFLNFRLLGESKISHVSSSLLALLI